MQFDISKLVDFVTYRSQEKEDRVFHVVFELTAMVNLSLFSLNPGADFSSLH